MKNAVFVLVNPIVRFLGATSFFVLAILFGRIACRRPDACKFSFLKFLILELTSLLMVFVSASGDVSLICDHTSYGGKKRNRDKPCNSHEISVRKLKLGHYLLIRAGYSGMLKS